ncbi:beta-1,4-galactosyltransferase 2, partial [Aplysia californica]|uniref:Beta-1,4-galactosyltransferase n=1 Tax=Aplysia californica TaxID=6500 RepID=A0ABM0ZZ29_APLCA
MRKLGRVTMSFLKRRIMTSIVYSERRKLFLALALVSGLLFLLLHTIIGIRLFSRPGGNTFTWQEADSVLLVPREISSLDLLNTKLRDAANSSRGAAIADIYTDYKNMVQNFGHRKASYDRQYRQWPAQDSGATTRAAELGGGSQGGVSNETLQTVLGGTTPQQQQQQKQATGASNSNGLPSCVDRHDILGGKFKPVMTELSPDALSYLFRDVTVGGTYTPDSCVPKEKTAIIIPFRDRSSHLNILLLNLLPMLKRQKVDFTVFVIDQQLPSIFNRGLLFNVGFLEASKLGPYDCFIFHDVDLVPINDLNFYHCNDGPTHFISGVNKFNYSLLYRDMFGGIVSFKKKQFLEINGASNMYFGWGGEDDDLRVRVVRRGLKIVRKYADIGLYDMIKHGRENSNGKNPVRGGLLKLAGKRQDSEGLSTIRYKVQGVDLLPLYTRVTVTVNMTEVLETAPPYMDKLTKSLLATDANNNNNSNN